MKKLTWLHISLGFSLILQCIILLSSCNSTKKITEGELLLDKNIITTKSLLLDKGEIEAYIKQQPNRKVLFWKFYLHIYNRVNQEKIEKKKIRKDARIESINSLRIEKNNQRNVKREAKGKKSKKAFLKKKNTLTWREWLLRIGEQPVIYDSLLARKSARQINLYLNNKGFFNSKVKDSLSVRNKKAAVHYSVHTGKPYLFRNLLYEIKDEQLKYYVLSDAPSTFIKQGINYDVEALQKERDRITGMLRNDGYFLFSKEYIYFEIDSSLGKHEVDIKIGIKNPILKIEGKKDSTTELPHSRFYIKNIYICTDYDPKQKTLPKDTLTINDYHLMSTGALRYKTRLITDAIFISKGELFQQSHADQTYRRLSELKLFRSVQIQFVPIGNSQVECFVYLSNIPKQSFSVETEGTNTSGTLGIAGSLVYQNKNTFKGGEILEIKLKGALEIQMSNSDETIVTESPIPFNTLELGNEVNLFIPRFVTPFNIKTPKNNNAKTNLTANYNLQLRPEVYGRSIANIAFGYSWNETSTKKHIINPIEFNLVNIFDDSTLQATISASKDKDLFLKNSYSDHFTLGTRYGFIFNNQNIRKKNKNFTYFRFGAEAAGNAMRGIFLLIDKQLRRDDDSLSYYPDTTFYPGPSWSIPFEKNFTIKDIRFSQFVRTDIDCRFYKFLREKSKLVFRVALGVGKPLYNLRVLPLEKSFFAGGPNSIRAWQARTLGPGGFTDSDNSDFADKIGDVKIESNIEYRFNVIKILNAALFVDAGNIWLRKEYESYKRGHFSFLGDSTVGSFIYHVAIGAGVGIRLDFNFFILRLDGAFKVKDPARKTDDRWMFGKPLETVLNFGIGYPF
ncbi:MAG: hypothetical protein EPN85_13050 [Bacteroidetes bacterium]|nr:MAG: hypothetical protein EPN85_13050 [Bacteroidota bacterium]